MAYQFINTESVDAGGRRIVREEIAASIRRLAKARGPRERDQAIHEVRKSVKKVRSLLRLMRAGLGEAYAAENAAWREIGRKLSGPRDAGVMIQVFDAVRVGYPDKAPAKIRRQLAVWKRGEDRADDKSHVLEAIQAELKRADVRVKRWPVQKGGFAAIAPGLKQSFKKGARALEVASKKPSPENMHELRKVAKAHLYQVRLLTDLWDGHMRHQEKRLHKLEELLGDHHNLHVLKMRLVGQPDAEPFLQLMDRLQKKLERQALRLSPRIYGDSSGSMDRLRRLWRKWAVS